MIYIIVFLILAGIVIAGAAIAISEAGKEMED